MGLLGLLGWILGMPLLSSIRSSYIPMAPLSAIAFICLGGVLLVRSMGPSQGPVGVIAALLSALLSAYGLIALVEGMGIPVLSLEEWLFPDRPIIGAIPAGRMSLPTAVLLLLSGTVAPMLYLRERGGTRRKFFVDLPGCLGILVAVIGTVFVFGYLHGAPFMYGTSGIPMAATTALAFLLLGAGQVFAAGPDGFPSRLFTGPSTRARLLRVFVSTTVGVVVAIDLMHVYVDGTFFEGNAFMSGVSTMVLAVMAGALIARVALNIGDDMDRSEGIRKHTEGKLARLGMAVDQAAEAIIITDREGTILYVNPAFERISGYSREEAVGKNPRILRSGKQDKSLYREIWGILARGEVWTGHLINRRKDGSLYEEDATISPVRDSSGNIISFVAVMRDVTQLLLIEKQMRTAQKMEAVGTLAGGIAHDFNNALTGIVGFGELLRMRMAGDEQALHDLDEIQRCAERASTLTRQLLTFARRQVIEPVNLDLNTLAADLMKLIGKVVGEHIEVKTFLGKNVPTIHADRGQIEQVLMNLCLNARDSMPEGGRLVVETGDVVLDEECVRRNPYMKTGRYALLTVSDTGTGMDEKTRERVFEPFFTTKGPDKGTGLGLAMVYGIVKQHGGFIHLYSEPGKGTAFKVYFPAIEAQPDAIPEKHGGELVRGGTETILLAEDEESILSFIERALKALGYAVLVARNGEEAVEMFRRHKEIVLAVLDVVMPRKGGKEAFEEMRKAKPELKVIYMSGYSVDAIHDSFVLIPGTPYLQKPFGPAVLARKVREVLDAQ